MSYQKNEDPILLRTITNESQASGLVTNFWGRIKEIKFPIDSQILKRMLGTSPTNLVGIRVENFTNLALTNATWVSFEEGSPPADSTNPNIFYAMLDATLVNEITKNPTFNIINARLASKQPDVPISATNFCVFFHKSKLTGKGGGTGGVGDGCGAIVR